MIVLVSASTSNGCLGPHSVAVITPWNGALYSLCGSASVSESTWLWRTRTWPETASTNDVYALAAPAWHVDDVDLVHGTHGAVAQRKRAQASALDLREAVDGEDGPPGLGLLGDPVDRATG